MSQMPVKDAVNSKLGQKILLWTVAIISLLILWAIFISPTTTGCRPGGEVTASECGYN